MLALNQNFNSRADSMEANNVLYEQMLRDANPKTLAEYDDFFRRNGNDSNEGALGVVRGAMDAAGGKAGAKLAGLGQLIDKNTEGREAADAARSSNVSQRARIVEEEQVIGNLGYDVPEMAAIGHTKEELEVSLASVYEQLRAAGVPETDLNHAMAAGGVDDPRATVEKFFDLAQDNNLPVTGYIMDLDQGFVQLQIEDGVDDIAPVVGLEIDDPAMKMALEDFSPSVQPAEPSPVRLG